MQGDTREYKGIHENTRKYKRTQENKREYRGIQRDIWGNNGGIKENI